MMKLSLPILGLLAVPIICFALTEYNNQKDFIRETPQPISGVQIVPTSMLSGDGSSRKHDLLRMGQMKRQGYIESDSPNAKSLMAIKEHATSEIEQYKNDPNPYDTHLKKSVSDIQLAFPYKQPSAIEVSNILGFSAAGSWKNGWTAIGEFFDDKNLGVCSYTTYNLKLTKMGIKINADAVTYVVNGKPTTFEVEGSNKSGFRYIIGWTDDTFDNDLTCAKMNFDKMQIDKMIELANAIDKRTI